MTQEPGDSRLGAWRDARRLLALLLILGMATRLFGLEIQSLWFDELFSWRIASCDTLPELIDQVRRTDVHPPGHVILLHQFLKVAGDSEWALRLPSAVAGILAIAVIFLLGRRLYSRWEGLTAAGLMAASWAPQYYSQEARAYSLLLLFTMITAGLWWDLVRRLRCGAAVSLGLAVSYVVTAIITCYLHYFGLYIVVLFGLAGLCVVRGKSIVAYGGLQAVVLGAFGVWIPVVLSQAGRDHFWIERPVPEDLWDWWRYAFSRSGLLSLGALGLLAAWLIRWLMQRPRRASAPTTFLCGWLVIALLGSYTISLTFRPILTERNLIICLPPAYLLLARAVSRMPWRPKVRVLVAAAFFVVSAVQVFLLLDYYGKPRKNQYRELTQQVLAGPIGDDTLILATDSLEGYNYYFEKNGSGRRTDALAGSGKGLRVVRDRLEQRDYNQVWLMQGLTEVEPEVLDFLSSRYRRTDRTDLRRATLWLFSGRMKER